MICSQFGTHRNLRSSRRLNNGRAAERGDIMFYKVQEVQPLPAYGLLVIFATGERKRYNVKPLFEKWEPFKALASVKGLFEQVKVDAGGYGISWNDDIDLSCNELWENGEPVETATPDDVEAIREARAEYARGQTVPHEAINWN